MTRTAYWTYVEQLHDLYEARAAGPLPQEEESRIASLLETLWGQLTDEQRQQVERLTECFKDEQAERRP